MANVAETRKTIKALPGMTAQFSEGEWRVTINIYRLSERYPDKSTAWCEEKQEAMAYYTVNSADAIETAMKMSKTWMEGEAEMRKDVVLVIEETGNAAFVDIGRNQEVGRIIAEAAKRIETRGELENFPLHDINGNRVGRVAFGGVTPSGDPPDGTVRLVIKGGDADIEERGAIAIARIMHEAAAKVRNGEDIFGLHDVNGNLVGKFEFRQPPSLECDGVVDMNEALNSGRVYMAEDGYSGIAEGAYRYAVTAGDFEPGYGHGNLDVWLVNAKGEVAGGYETPQSVRENLLCELSRDQKCELRDVLEGRVSFEDFERRFDVEADL